jgi:RNA polymerase sigma-70 factor (ECF subfamily)
MWGELVGQTASDEQLLAWYARGEQQALEELFRRHRAAAYRVAYRRLGQDADALDAVQEGFIKALRHLGDLRRGRSFKTWLLRIIMNVSIDLKRQRERRGALGLDESWSEKQENDEASKGLEGAELRHLLQEALSVLPEAQRQTFVLHAEAELAYREVADILGIPLGTVMSRLFHARRKLRAFLQPRMRG